MNNPLLEALKQKLKVQIRYFTQILHIGIDSDAFKTPLILCLSEHSLIFLDATLSSLISEVYYAHVLEVSEALNHPNSLLKFEFSPHRPQSVPKKLTLISADKNNLLKHLKCYWETDHLYRYSKVSKLQVTKTNIDITRYIKSNKRNLDLYLKPPPGSLRYEEGDYGYFIDDLFELNYNKNNGQEYFAVYEEVKYTLRLEIQGTNFVECFKDNIRVEVEKKVEDCFSDQDWGLVVNQAYIKKFNLNMDLAVWEGWEMGVASEGFQGFVIGFRRKFIPPLMDSSQILLVICKGGKYSRFFCENTADSIFSLHESDEVYRNIMQQKCDALIMNEETMKFYQDNFEIVPDKVFFASRILVSLLKTLNKQFEDPKLSKRIEMLKKNPLYRGPNPGFSGKAEVNKLLDGFIKSSYLASVGAGYKIWKNKVLRYTSYCINGGLTDNRLNYSEILPLVLKLNTESRETQGVKIFLSRLLNIRSPVLNEEIEDIVEAVSIILGTGGFSTTRIKYSPSTIWSFNQILMSALIETNYLKRELEVSLEPVLYPKFIIYLLQQKGISTNLKISAIKATSTLEDSTNFTTSTLIPHLLDNYLCKDTKIATPSAESLLSLIQFSKPNKRLLFSSLDTILNRLSSKSPQLLFSTLALLNTLSLDQTNHKMIFKKANQIIISLIMTPKYIPKNFDVIKKVLQILTVLIKDPVNNKFLTENERFLYYCIDLIGKDEETNPVLIELFQVLCNRNQTAKVFIGKKGIPRLLEYLKSSQSLKNIKSVISLFRVLSTHKNDENFKVLTTKQTVKILETLLQTTKITSEPVLTQQLKDLKDYLVN